MKENKFTKALTGFGKSFITHRPEIMLGIGIGGLIVSAFFVGYETPKFKKLLEEEKQKNDSKKIPVGDFTKMALKCYAAPVSGFIFSGASLAKGLFDVNKKNVALSAASAISEATTKELIDRMKNEIGEKKTEKVINDMDEKGVPITGIVPTTSKFEFEDAFTGTRFCTNVRAVEKAFMSLGKDILYENYAKLSDLYWYMMSNDKNLEIEIPKVANALGWGTCECPTGEVSYNIDSRYYPNEDVVRLILSYQAPCEDYDRY